MKIEWGLLMEGFTNCQSINWNDEIVEDFWSRDGKEKEPCDKNRGR